MHGEDIYSQREWYILLITVMGLYIFEAMAIIKNISGNYLSTCCQCSHIDLYFILCMKYINISLLNSCNPCTWNRRARTLRPAGVALYPLVNPISTLSRPMHKKLQVLHDIYKLQEETFLQEDHFFLQYFSYNKFVSARANIEFSCEY